MTRRVRTLSFACSILVTACASPVPEVAPGILVARLDEGSSAEFVTLAAEVASRNPGYRVDFLRHSQALPATDDLRLAFVQHGSSTIEIEGDATTSSEVGEGDLVALRPLHAMRAVAPLDLVVFTVPTSTGPLPFDVPPVLRPDHDPAIDDQRGGCATEDKPYRRLLLTWRPENGPYVFHGLNAHRVKIENSFTHYHPVEGGFDEFYLVQRGRPGAELITSARRESIESESLDPRSEDWLFRHPLVRSELVYIPRGVVHRGIGGAVVMVITIPGFRPGAEIGVDHHLRAIAERNGAPDAVPFHEEASKGPIVR